MELWEYTGEPQPEEIIQRIPDYEDNHLAIRCRCPNCERFNTAWIRQEWYVCFTCIIAFTQEDSVQAYDTELYEKDERLPEEWYYE